MPSETAERTFSIRAGLAASTVTPGSTAPDVSLTAPAMTACANVIAGKSAIPAAMVRVLTKRIPVTSYFPALTRNNGELCCFPWGEMLLQQTWKRNRDSPYLPVTFTFLAPS